MPRFGTSIGTSVPILTPQSGTIYCYTLKAEANEYFLKTMQFISYIAPKSTPHFDRTKVRFLLLYCKSFTYIVHVHCSLYRVFFVYIIHKLTDKSPA